MELKDQFKNLGKNGEKVKKGRYMCPSCKQKCTFLMRDSSTKVTVRFVCEECYGETKDKIQKGG